MVFLYVISISFCSAATTDLKTQSYAADIASIVENSKLFQREGNTGHEFAGIA
jgi:hypothetical protein